MESTLKKQIYLSKCENLLADDPLLTQKDPVNYFSDKLIDIAPSCIPLKIVSQPPQT